MGPRLRDSASSLCRCYVTQLMFHISECKDTHLDVRAVLAADGDEQGEARLGAPPVRLLPIFQAAVLVVTCCRGGKQILLQLQVP